jgi:hypothetical protein
MSTLTYTPIPTRIAEADLTATERVIYEATRDAFIAERPTRLAHSATLTAQVPTNTPTPTLTPTQIPSPTPTYEVRGDWKIYRNDDLGFEFAFPSSYGEDDLSGCRIYTREDDDEFYLRLGERTELLVRFDVSEDLSTFVSNYIAEKTEPDYWRVSSETESNVGGKDAITIEYRFGGQRYGTATFVRHDSNMYQFNYHAGGDCFASSRPFGEID